MSDERSVSGTVHWLGIGLSTGPDGLRAVCDRADRVVVWDRTEHRGTERLAGLGLSHRVEVRALDDAALAAEVRPGDVVVSMLPATEHARLLRLAVERRAHFACTSYTSEEMRELAEVAADAGLVVLTEAGLDPGIDHLMAHLLVDRARREVGDTADSVDFTSYCGGLPAVPNDFRYRFSWAPYGVLAALGTPATYVEGGETRTALRPWEATRALTLAKEQFEVYPNRDSRPFITQYGVPANWSLGTFVRGTLRNSGWRAAWSGVFETVRAGDQGRVRSLARELADRYPATQADRDRVVLSVALRVRGARGTNWQGAYFLDLVGDESGSAMARCVSLPLAFGITRILDGALPAGLCRAAETPDEADRWLEHLREHGVSVTFDDNLPVHTETSV